MRKSQEEIVLDSLPRSALALLRLSKAQLVGLATYLGAACSDQGCDNLSAGVHRACMEAVAIRHIVPGAVPKIIRDISAWRVSVYDLDEEN